MMTKERILHVDNLSTSFHTDRGWLKAIDGVSFDVYKGEILGIVGESGCGKSVTSQSIMRLYDEKYVARYTGRVELDGRSLLDIPYRKMQDVRGRDVSMIFQDALSSLNPVLKISDQLMEPLRIHQKLKPPQARERAVEMLRLVGIPSPERRMKQYPFAFSGGMRQRIIIAIALACNPKLLIADEPTTALDVTVQAQILELIRKRARQDGTSVIMITHDLGVVASLCDRISILYGGRIVETGATDEIFYETKHPYTKGLLNSISRRRALPDGTFARGEIASIPGTPPDLLHINTGCPFASRCDAAMKICRDYLPATTSFSPSHSACCWLYCREQAQAIVEKQDRERGEAHG